MTVVRSINAHAGEIDDLDFHPNSKKVSHFFKSLFSFRILYDLLYIIKNTEGNLLPVNIQMNNTILGMDD